MATAGAVVAGRYRLVQPLAGGGMSHVWLATDERSGHPVALKEVVAPADLDPQDWPRLRRWATHSGHALTRLVHPNVVRLLDVLPGNDGPWLVMEYVPSRSLLQVIQTEEPLAPARVAQIGLAVLSALTAVRRAGLLHLDVKPSNVLIADDGRILLADFGPTVTPETIEAMTAAGMVLGSPPYVAPELLTGCRATARADLWSLGAALYHAVEGRPPFVEADIPAMLRAIRQDAPAPVRRAGALAPVLSGLLRKDPAERMTASEAANRLHRLTGRLPSPAHRVRLPVAVTGALAMVLALGAASAPSQTGQVSGNRQIGNLNSGGERPTLRHAP